MFFGASRIWSYCGLVPAHGQRLNVEVARLAVGPERTGHAAVVQEAAAEIDQVVPPAGQAAGCRSAGPWPHRRVQGTRVNIHWASARPHSVAALWLNSMSIVLYSFTGGVMAIFRPVMSCSAPSSSTRRITSGALSPAPTSSNEIHSPSTPKGDQFLERLDHVVDLVALHAARDGAVDEQAAAVRLADHPLDRAARRAARPAGNPIEALRAGKMIVGLTSGSSRTSVKLIRERR